MKQHDKYKLSNIRWINQIPNEWKEVRNKGLFKVVKKIVGKSVDDFKVLSLTLNGVIYRDLENKVGKMPKDFEGYQIVEPENIVLCLFDMDVTPRIVGYSNKQGLVSSAYTVIKAKDKTVNPQYYYYWFLAMDNNKALLAETKGLRNTMKDSDFMSLISAFPSIEEQGVIVDTLHIKLQEIGDFIKQKQKSIELLKQYKQSKINELVTKGLNPNVKMKDSGTKWLGKVPEHWRILKLKKLVKLNSSTSKNLNNKVALENIESWTGRFIQGEGNPFEADGVQFENGDVLFCKLRPYLAKVFLPTEDGVCVNELLVLKPNTNLVSKEFIYTRLLTYDFIQLVNSSTYGAKMPRASWDFIGEIEIPFPTDFEEQNAIFNMTNQINTGINQLIDKALNQIELIQQYRQSLIYELVTGKRKP